ncbi:hypothetical protein LTR08_000068 [Meristemomyces frigidus]|nr:hypothetical protein LTR08_000068 [Meristemomyces frigidus]
MAQQSGDRHHQPMVPLATPTAPLAAQPRERRTGSVTQATRGMYITGLFRPHHFPCLVYGTAAALAELERAAGAENLTIAQDGAPVDVKVAFLSSVQHLKITGDFPADFTPLSLDTPGLDNQNVAKSSSFPLQGLDITKTLAVLRLAGARLRKASGRRVGYQVGILTQESSALGEKLRAQVFKDDATPAALGGAHVVTKTLWLYRLVIRDDGAVGRQTEVWRGFTKRAQREGDEVVEGPIPLHPVTGQVLEKCGDGYLVVGSGNGAENESDGSGSD